MNKKIIGIFVCILFVGASVVSGINIQLKNTSSPNKSGPENTLNVGSSGSGLVAYWNFDDGTAHDNSGNNHNGIVYGASVVNGISGNGFRFDGDDDYIDLGDDPDFDITGNITIALWFKTDTSQLGTFVSKLDPLNPDNGYNLVMGDIINYYPPNASGTIYLMIAKDSTGLAQYDVVQTVSSYTDNIWHFLTAIYTPDGVSRPKIYIDAVEQSVNYDGIPLSSIGASPGYNFKIAEYSPESGYFNFNGTLDEVRLYDRALTIDEIQYLYDNPGVGDIVYVDDNFNSSTPGWQIDHFDKIQDGIDVVNEGGTVFVYNGTYYENAIVDKTINLIGENRDTTIIDGGGSGDVVNVIDDGVSLNNFTTRNSGGIPSAGIWLISNENSINNNRIIDCIDDGIRLDDSSSNNVINDNIIRYTSDGIGIEHSSNNNIISKNLISNSTHAGTEDYGIAVLHNSEFNIINNNNIIELDWGIYLADESNNNNIYHNNLINNSQNAYDECENTWNLSYPSGGNYWSDYPYDDDNHGPNQDILGHDRIGDVPYDLPCEHAIDYYPVMHPYGWLNGAPENITIDGPTQGKAGQLYTYTTSAEDPEFDPIYYKFNWGDGNFSDWLGPYISETEASDSHSWSKGTFEIKVKAKDTRGLESEWSDPFPITMPRNKVTVNSLLLWFLEQFPLLERLLNLMV